MYKAAKTADVYASSLTAGVGSVSTGATPAKKDATGRAQMVGNVLANWLGYLVLLVAGLVMPRLIDGRLGTTMLGIWDFAWSTVSYYTLIQIGIVGSVNRFVARHQAEGDQLGVNQAVSSVTVILMGMAAIIVVLTGVAYSSLAALNDPKFQGHLPELRWAVVILGMEIALGTGLAAFGGVVTGYHKWKLYTVIQTIGATIGLASMITVLLLGGGLRGIAFAHFAGEITALLLRWIFAYRVCPGLEVRWRHVNWGVARNMFQFGTKAFLPNISDMLLNQTTNVLIGANLGPAALAYFSRPRNLVLQMRTLVHKMGAVLVPAVGSMSTGMHQAELRELVIKATRYAAYLMLPVTVFLSVLGGSVLHVWMGASYANELLMLVMAVGYSSFLVQLPVMALLGGLNRHGRPGIAHFIASLVTVVLVYIAVGPLKLGLVGVALAGIIPLAITYTFWIPMYAARLLDLPIGTYFRRAYSQPLMMGLGLAACLLPVRLLWHDRPLVSVITGAGIAAVVLGPYYWNSVVPPAMKRAVLRRLPFFR